MDHIEITKKVAGLIVGTGTAKIVTAIIQNNVSYDKITTKVPVVIAGIVIGAMAKDATKAYSDAKIDYYAAFLKKTEAETKTETTA